MKTANKIMAVTMSALALAACNDLDTELLGGYASTEQKKEMAEVDPEILNAAAADLNTTMYQIWLVASSGHQDYGYPNMMLILDSRGIDLVSDNIGFNWYSYCSAFQDIAGNASNTVYCWSYPYQYIAAANRLLSSTGEEPETDALKYYAAQALAERSWAYWNLINTYQYTYAGHENDPGVPILTEKNSDDCAINGCPRGTVQDVYNQMMDDINKAISLLENTSTTASDVVSSKPKRMISIPTAYGLRARYNLFMQKWNDAAADAEKAISLSGKPLSLELAANPDNFWNLDDAHWMWGLATNETDGPGSSNIINWPSHMGSFCSDSYAEAGAWRKINSLTYAAIPDTDVRKGWWLNGEGVGVNLPEEWQAFCTAGEIPPYTQIKFGPFKGSLGNAIKGQDIPFMRVEEMYLIKAEAMAMDGNPTGGAEFLTSFVKTYRDPAYSFASGDPQAVQEEVWQQRRIELWGEGLSFFDIMRLKKGVDRRGSNWCEEWTYNIPPEDHVLRYTIPERETNSNKQIPVSENNGSWPQPTPVTE